MRRQQNNACPLDVFELAVPIADDGGQSGAVLGSYDHANILCHIPRIARSGAFMNRSFVSVH